MNRFFLFRSQTKNQKGIALVMVLVFSAIALAVIGVLVYMLISGTQISGMVKRYLTALESVYGAQEIERGDINSRDILTPNAANFVIPLGCRRQKLLSDTNAANWALCVGTTTYVQTTNLTINSAVPATFDASFGLGAAPAPVYTVFTKIVGTTQGNTVPSIPRGSAGSLLLGGTSDTGTEIPLQQVPYNYRIQVLSVNNANPNDTAVMSYIYQY